MSLGIAQQVGTKNDRQNSKNKQPATYAIVLSISLIFPPVTVSLQLFYFFNYFFIFFYKQETYGMEA
jgi:hypothetical protein